MVVRHNLHFSIGAPIPIDPLPPKKVAKRVLTVRFVHIYQPYLAHSFFCLSPILLMYYIKDIEGDMDWSCFQHIVSPTSCILDWLCIVIHVLCHLFSL